MLFKSNSRINIRSIQGFLTVGIIIIPKSFKRALIWVKSMNTLKCNFSNCVSNKAFVNDQTFF